MELVRRCPVPLRVEKWSVKEGGEAAAKIKVGNNCTRMVSSILS